MKNKNGFTLIELLAVIVILSIILVIAVSSVTGSVNKSKESAFMTSYDNLVESVRNNIVQRKIDKTTQVACADESLNGGNDTLGKCSEIYEYEKNEYMFYVIEYDDLYYVFLEGKENGKFINIDLSKNIKPLADKGIFLLDYNGIEAMNSLACIISKNGKVLKGNDIEEMIKSVNK